MPPDIKELSEQAQMLYSKGDYAATQPLFEQICHIARHPQQDMLKVGDPRRSVPPSGRFRLSLMLQDNQITRYPLSFLFTQILGPHC